MGDCWGSGEGARGLPGWGECGRSPDPRSDLWSCGLKCITEHRTAFSNPARPRALFLLSVVTSGSLELLCTDSLPPRPGQTQGVCSWGGAAQAQQRPSSGLAGPSAVGADIFLTSECFSGERKYSMAAFLQLFQKVSSCDWFWYFPPRASPKPCFLWKKHCHHFLTLIILEDFLL